MEVRIGVQNVARELTFESSQSVEDRKYVVPVTALGYIHIGETEKSRVGFGTD